MGLFGKPEPRPVPETARVSPPQAQTPPPKPPARGTVMGEKTRYVGRIDSEEPLLILGQVEGEIKSASEVEVGAGGDVKATVSARSIVISGRVTGDCQASDRLEIRASGRLHGSIHAGRIAIADGAEFKGTSQMTPNPKS